MIVSIHQPAYLPWLGYFERIALSDLHVVLDHVQFEKNSFCNRNKVRTSQGWAWLTVPVRTKGMFGRLPLNRIEIDENKCWQKKHRLTIEQSYKRAPHRDPYLSDLEPLWTTRWRTLHDLTRYCLELHLRWLGITTPIVRSSSLRLTSAKSDLVLEICRKVGAKTYLSGPLGRDYLDLQSFAANKIEVLFHDYRHPEYPQVYSPFVPHMAAIDLVFNCGPDSKNVLMTTRCLRHAA